MMHAFGTTGQVLDQLAVSEFVWHFVHVVLVKRNNSHSPLECCVVMSRWERWRWCFPTSPSRWRAPGLRLWEEPKWGVWEKNLCWCLPSAPPWEPHVKTDTCSLIALSQDPDCACVCLYDSRFLCVPLNLGLCDCVSAKPSGKPHTSGPLYTR